MDHTTKLLNYLQENQVQYQHLTHPECKTSKESREARINAGGEDVIGAKAIVIKMDRKGSGSEFNLLVLPGTHKLDSSIIKAYFKADIKSFRFATTEELAELTGGLVPGSSPPFTQPILDKLTHLFVDFALLKHDKIGFNAASLTQSLIIQTKDYLQVAKTTDMFEFSQEVI
jgi:prolyl-tRNA editing enzyme YbaK/EbsC (Cys-tRNA(Pro) deacylase)